MTHCVCVNDPLDVCWFIHWERVVDPLGLLVDPQGVLCVDSLGVCWLTHWVLVDSLGVC